MTYADYEWFLKQNLHDYGTQWVAIINKKVVAADNNVEKLINTVKKEYPKKVPFVTKTRNQLSILLMTSESTLQHLLQQLIANIA